MAEIPFSSDTPPKIPGFEIISKIGSGAMGGVYLARQHSLKRQVALKFLATDSVGDPSEKLGRFLREAELMAQVSHPNIVSVFDVGTVNGASYLVMEHVEGGNLRHLMETGKPMPLEQVRAVLQPVGQALTALHRHGILHRDLKPENILMDEHHNPKVGDFGISVLESHIGELTRPSESFGTLGYIAPEQQYRLPIDERVDQYSLAAVAYEMLTGKQPVGVIKPPSFHNPKLHPRIDQVLLRGLSEDPDDRYATVQEFTEALDCALCRHQTRRRRIQTVTAAATVAVVLVGGALAWLNRPASTPEKQESGMSANSQQRQLMTASTLENGTNGISTDQPTDESPSQTQEHIHDQSGVIAYRFENGELRILLISSRKASHWVIPKGNVEQNETLWECAATKAYEEGGVKGSVFRDPFGSYIYQKKGKTYNVVVFPFQVDKVLSDWPENLRRREWLSIEAAAERVNDVELRQILRRFHPPTTPLK